MNNTTHNNYARLSSKLATFIAVLTSFFFVACSEKKPELKVVKTNSVVSETVPANFFITDISDSGVVWVGRDRNRNVATNSTDGHLFHLEGKAVVGDPIVLVWYHEEQLLENGEVRKVLTKVGVKSVRGQEHEKKFSPTQ
jgi:hypothetical protein